METVLYVFLMDLKPFAAMIHVPVHPPTAVYVLYTTYIHSYMYMYMYMYMYIHVILLCMTQH